MSAPGSSLAALLLGSVAPGWLALALVACGGGDSGGGGLGAGGGNKGTVATPAILPAAGSYHEALTISISDATAGATIHYTTDGTTPTANSPGYGGPFLLTAGATVRALAAHAGQNDSAAASAAYTLTPLAGTPAYTWKNVQIRAGGFVSGIVAHPAVPGLLYARTDIGGAYRWNDASGTWTPLTDWITTGDFNHLGIEAIGIDRSDANRLYLAAGAYAQSWASNGQMLVSSDRGASFTVVPLPFKFGGNENGRGAGERIAVDPNQGAIVYLGSRQNGLWRSADHGSSWSQVTSFPVTGVTTGNKNTGVGVVAIAFQPASATAGQATPVIYAVVSDTGDESAGPIFPLYRSVDGGQSWSAVPGQPLGLYPNHGAFGPDGNLYLTYGDDVGPNGMTRGAVWRYTPPPSNAANGAGSWLDITPPAPSYANNGSYGYGSLALDPAHVGVLVVATMDLWYLHDDLWRSSDGGATWHEAGVDARLSLDASSAPWISQYQPSGPGWWIAGMAIDSGNADQLFYGTGAMVWKSSNLTAVDSGGTLALAASATGLEETAALGLVSPASGAPLVSAVGDVCGFVHANVGAPPAASLASPRFSTGTGIDIAGQDPAVLARVGHQADATQLGGWSPDGGITWMPFAGRPSGTSSGGGSIAVSADGSAFVWASDDAATAYSVDHGATWAVSTGAPARKTVIADRVDPQRLYIVSGAALYGSTDGGKTFTLFNNALPVSSGSLAARPDVSGDLWLAGDSGVYRSVDGGAHFMPVAGLAGVRSIGFGKGAAGQATPAVYALSATVGSEGFYRSLDGGLGWTKINDAAHQYGVATLVIGDPRVFGRMYVGTNGRGIVYADSAQ
ncbi:MAG TPA: chitobiase/beta-hexosaminidase C-terminal domain-containing protein [Burkholderiaceae bacterium]|nr:chitobiase/beta-hexosaminidase C-terminal domain-containing protein [Burkholderiaceae bacterium]